MADMFADEDSARFFQMIQMLQRSTMLHMGYLPDQEGKFHYDLLEAKDGITRAANSQAPNRDNKLAVAAPKRTAKAAKQRDDEMDQELVLYEFVEVLIRIGF